MTKDTTPTTPLKAIVIVGPDSNGNHKVAALIATFKKSGLKEGDDFLVIGDGEHYVRQEDIQMQIQGRVDATSRFFIWGHGGVEKVNGTRMHTIDLLQTDPANNVSPEEQGTTDYLLRMLQNIAGKQPVYVDVASCFAGKAKSSIENLEEGSFLVTHATRKFVSYISTNRQTILNSVKRHVERASSPDFDPEQAVLSDFIHTISATIETVNISHKDNEGKVTHHSSRTPEKILSSAKAFESHMLEHNLTNYMDFVRKRFPESHKGVKHQLSDIPFKQYFQEASFAKKTFNRILFGASHNIPAYTQNYAQASLPERVLIYPYRRMQIVQEAAEAGSAAVLEQYFEHNSAKYINTPYRTKKKGQEYKNGKSLLHFAAPHVRAVEVLLQHGADPNLQDSSRCTPLHYAAGHHRSTKALLEKGANPNMLDDYLETPLHYESQRGNHHSVKLLLKHRANPNFRNKKGKTALHLAIQEGHEKTAICLLGHPDIRSDIRDMSSTTPLHLAAQKGMISIIEKLQEQNANPDALDKDQRTPLHWAVRNGHTQSVKALLKYKADPDIQNSMGATALHIAIRFRKADVAALLLNNEADPDIQDIQHAAPLHWAVHNQDIDSMKLLFRHQANPSIQDMEGATPLHWAIHYDLPNAVTLLLEHNADPNIQDRYRQTPLHLAVSRGYTETVDALLKQGANPYITNSDGLSAYEYARQAEFEAIVELIESREKALKTEEKIEEKIEETKHRKKHQSKEGDMAPSSHVQKLSSSGGKKGDARSEHKHRRRTSHTHKKNSSFSEQEKERKRQPHKARTVE